LTTRLAGAGWLAGWLTHWLFNSAHYACEHQTVHSLAHSSSQKFLWILLVSLCSTSNSKFFSLGTSQPKPAVEQACLGNKFLIVIVKSSCTPVVR